MENDMSIEQKVIAQLLRAAEDNLARYEQGDDERAIRAGRGMVEGLRADLAAAQSIPA